MRVRASERCHSGSAPERRRPRGRGGRGSALKAALLDRSGLREKAPRQLVLAQLTSTIGDLMVLTALPFAVFAVRCGLGQLGLALGVQSPA